MIALLVVLGLIFLILIHELGHFLFAKLFGIKVEEFGFGYPPRLSAKKIGETEYSLNLLPFGGFVKIAGMEKEISNPGISAGDFEKQSVPKKLAVLIGGILANFLAGWLMLALVFWTGISPFLAITGIQPNSPAAYAGLKIGDEIASAGLAATKFSSAQEFLDFVSANRGKNIVLNVKREGKNLEIQVVPRINPPAGEGALGILFAEGGIKPLPFFPALFQSLKQSFFISWLIVKTFGVLVFDLFTHGSLLEGVVGPIGVFGVAEQAGSLGLIFILNLFALIALNLAVLNLLPLPALDGGHLFLILLEKIKGSPISRGIKNLINQIGFAFLIILMILISARDIYRLF